MKYYVLIALAWISAAFADDATPWLSTKKTKIVNPQGQEVVLKGINLGGWLVEEMWMLPFVLEPPKDKDYALIQDHISLWQVFEKRFGKDKMVEIRYAFRKAWISDRDFANIKKAGFNAVRLPFLYDLKNEPEGLFFWLDYAIELAKDHGLYVILDMHGAPGRQSSHNHTGHVTKSAFFIHSPHVDETCSIWKELAKRYKDCPHIAGYDLLNEPMDAPSRKELYKKYNDLYKAVRSEDKRHIIFIQDGYKGVSSMPHPKEYKWENVAISTHHYTFDEHTSDEFMSKFNEHLKKVKEKQKQIETPFYLGEFNVAPRGSFNTLEKVMHILHEKKISYSFWSYKIGRRGHKNSLWALYFAPGRQKNIDPFRDSFRTILDKISRLKTTYYEKNDDLINLFRY